MNSGGSNSQRANGWTVGNRWASMRERAVGERYAAAREEVAGERHAAPRERAAGERHTAARDWAAGGHRAAAREEAAGGHRAAEREGANASWHAPQAQNYVRVVARAVGRAAAAYFNGRGSHGNVGNRNAPSNARTSEAAHPAKISLLYESRDGRLCLFEDAQGHVTAVPSERLA